MINAHEYPIPALIQGLFLLIGTLYGILRYGVDWEKQAREINLPQKDPYEGIGPKPEWDDGTSGARFFRDKDEDAP